MKKFDSKKVFVRIEKKFSFDVLSAVVFVEQMSIGDDRRTVTNSKSRLNRYKRFVVLLRDVFFRFDVRHSTSVSFDFQIDCLSGRCHLSSTSMILNV